MINRRCAIAAIACAVAFPVLAESPAHFPVETVWIGESLAGRKFASVSRPTLQITRAGRASGTTGCNRYNAKATIEGRSITIGPVAMTRMACFGASGDNERLFAPAIGTATQWHMERRMLVIETAQGPLRFRRR